MVGLLDWFADPNNRRALGILSSNLMAAGAPSYDPGASQKYLAQGMQGYGDALAEGRERQLREEYRKAQLENLESETKERERKAEAAAAAQRMLLGPYLMGSGPAAGSVRAAQDEGMTSRGILAGFEGQQGDLLRGLAAISPEKATATALELSTRQAKAPTTREVKQGDEIVTQEFVGGKWQDVARGRRYKPQEGAAYKPLSEPAKLRSDYEYLKSQGVPETAPEMQAIKRKLAETGRPSGESMRAREMVASGEATVKNIVDTIIPDGQNVDMSAVTSMWAAIPKSQGRTTAAQMEEVASFILRLETGAQANESEIRSTAKRYQPSPLDSQATIKDKLSRLQSRFDRAKAISEGRQPSGPTPVEPKGTVRKTPGGFEYEVLK